MVISNIYQVLVKALGLVSETWASERYTLALSHTVEMGELQMK